MDDTSSGHLDLDALAELEEGLTEPQAAAAARAHVEACGDCRALMSRLRTTRALLSALPPESMPPHVAARVDAALSSEDGAPSGTILALNPRKRAWNSPAVAGSVAAAAVVILVAAVVAGTLIHHSGKQQSGSAATSGTHPEFGGSNAGVRTKQWATGSDYTAATIRTLVPRLVTGTPAGIVNGPSDGAATVPSPISSSSNAGSSGPSYSQDQLRASPAALAACGQILAGGVATTPLAVDFARFDGRPAVIFALPAIGHPSFLDVWVVRSACSASNLDLYFQRIPRPTG